MFGCYLCQGFILVVILIQGVVAKHTQVSSQFSKVIVQNETKVFWFTIFSWLWRKNMDKISILHLVLDIDRLSIHPDFADFRMRDANSLNQVFYGLVRFELV